MIINKLGNFPNFFKEELYSFAHVLWIGYCGACIIVFLNLKDEPEILNNLLPVFDPPDKKIVGAPYELNEDVRKKLKLLDYIFSYKSDFPYVIPLKDPEHPSATELYLSFFGGMIRHLYSTYRFALQYMIRYLDADIYLVNVFAFYLLPTILSSVVFFTIPISIFGINLFSCFTQKRIVDASRFAFAAFLNPFNTLGIGNFPSNIFPYISRVLYGCFITFFALPMVSFVSSISVWAYLMLLLNFLPLFLIFIGGMNWKDCIRDIITQIIYHKIGLCIIFLFYSIGIAYKNLNKPIALGTHLGIVILILLLLNIFVVLKNSFMALISGSVFTWISSWLYDTKCKNNSI